MSYMISQRIGLSRAELENPIEKNFLFYFIVLLQVSWEGERKSSKASYPSTLSANEYRI